jgi:hypothetical protein
MEMTQSQTPPPPENQSQRWMKYGANVALTIVMVIMICAIVIYIVQTHDRRIDTTTSGEFSLKPQTLNIIGDLKGKVTIVSLYTKTKPQTSGDEEPAADQPVADAPQIVADLLDEYRRDGKNIDVQVIDPAQEPDKLAKLHDQLVQDYGSQIKGYKDFLAEWDKQYKEFETLTTSQAAAMTAVTGGAAVDDSDDDSNTTNPSGFRSDLIRTIKELPRSLADVKDEVDTERAKKYPDWKSCVSSIKDFLSNLSQLSGSLATNFAKLKDQKDIPANVRKYMADSQPSYEQIRKDADALIDQSTKLGELKLDQLEQALKVDNPILVLGPDDWRVLQYRQIWPEDTELSGMVGGKVRPRFAGEQQITAAIYSLTANSKPKLCFVRPGGQPVTSAGFPPFVAAGVLSEIADRMRMYNFEIQEKDLSGTWAEQAQMQQMPSPPEPSDDEIKDSIWVVLDMPRSFNSGQADAPPPPPMAPRVKEHLDHGGSALIVFDYQAEDLHEALANWGITLHPDTLAVHEAVQLSSGSPADLVEDFKTRPMAFVVKDYGEHEITKPVQSLESVWVPTMCVSTTPTADATVTPLVPLDKAFGGLKVWGDTDVESIKSDSAPVYDPVKDIAPPIYGMAASENKSGGRVVVIGSPVMFNGRINIPDPAVAQSQHKFINRFPGNGELTANSIFWLAHLDPMIAISPAAMDVSRISDMSKGALDFWRYGVLLGLLPGAIIVAGLFVYAGRRD